jgi:hypothetical protein
MYVNYMEEYTVDQQRAGKPDAPSRVVLTLQEADLTESHQRFGAAMRCPRSPAKEQA